MIVSLGGKALAGLDERSCDTSGPVNTGIGERLQTGKPSRYVTIYRAAQPGQPSWINAMRASDAGE